MVVQPPGKKVANRREKSGYNIVQRAKLDGWGRGVSRDEANRAENKGARDKEHSKLTAVKMSKAG